MKRTFLILAVAALGAAPLFAQPKTVDCAKANEPLVSVPVLASDDATHVLRGTLYTVSEQQPMPKGSTCIAQWVRAYRLSAPPDKPDINKLIDPTPGPTLRARVGDVVELSFLNLIDRANFPNADRPCDSNGQNGAVYPGNPPFDTPPDCFSGSVMTNVHFHGTHTNPGSTGDNVFINIQPAERALGTRAPSITAAAVRPSFTEFFDRCTAELSGAVGPKQWPRFWNELPTSLQDFLRTQLQKSDPELWTIDERQIRQGAWPQYYVGAYPYCFKLPEYVDNTTPAAQPAAGANHDPAILSPHTAGRGMGEEVEAENPKRPLIMGQSPGTHWYHAHKHGSTTINVMNGMTGVFVIEGGYDDAINKIYGKNWTRSAKVLVLNQLGSAPNLELTGGGGPPAISVNGRLTPVIRMKPGEVQMWRVANTAWRSGALFVPQPKDALVWMQTAQDGVQLTPDNYATSQNKRVMLAPGNRADFLVQAPANGAGKDFDVQIQPFTDPAAPRGATTLLTVHVTNDPPVSMAFLTKAEFPEMPKFLRDIPDTAVKGTKVLSFSSTTPQGGGPAAPANVAQHEIDGKKFDGDVGAVVGLNQVEEWKIVNFTFAPTLTIAHPFHIHINPFQITSIFAPNEKLSDGTARYVFSADPNATVGKDQCRVDPTNATTVAATSEKCAQVVPPEGRIWWDVFPIPSGKIVNNVQIPGFFKMRSRFVDYDGFFVLHCHILAHEDRGMMTVVEVAPLQTPYSHH